MANKLSLKNRKPLRHQFGVLHDIADMPNLIEIQKSSYRQLLTSKTEENHTGAGRQNQEKHRGHKHILKDCQPRG